MLVLNHGEVESILDLGACIRALEEAYRHMASAAAVNRPRTHTFIRTSASDTFYLLKSMEGGIAHLGVMALRINSERWRLVRGDRRRREKLPSTADGRFTEFILLFGIEDGTLLAILPDGHIQRCRVSAAAALAAKYLARHDSQTLAVFGSGWQARSQIGAFREVLPIQRISVYSPTRKHRDKFVQRVSHDLGLTVEAVDEPKAAVDGADVVALATSAEEPVIQHTWLQKGVHVSTIRSKEVDARVLESCDLVVVHNRVPALDFVCGGRLPKEMRSPRIRMRFRDFPQLSDVVSGMHPGRIHHDQKTLFLQGGAGGAGLGIQFAAVGNLVYEEARKRGLGHEVPSDWFLDVERHPYQV